MSGIAKAGTPGVQIGFGESRLESGLRAWAQGSGATGPAEAGTPGVQIGFGESRLQPGLRAWARCRVLLVRLKPGLPVGGKACQWRGQRFWWQPD